MTTEETRIDAMVYLDEAFAAMELLLGEDSPCFRLFSEIVFVVVGTYGDGEPPTLSDFLRLLKLFAEAADGPLPAASGSGIV